MRTFICIVFVLLLSGGSLMSQSEEESALQSVILRSQRVDELFEARSAMIGTKASTKEIDQELAKLGVMFPARVVYDKFGERVNISFLLLDDIDDVGLVGKIERLKSETAEIDYLGVDIVNHFCTVTFRRGTSQAKIERFLGEFFYDGYYIAKSTVKERNISKN